jgi:flagellar hook-basal body complex protein FliE
MRAETELNFISPAQIERSSPLERRGPVPDARPAEGETFAETLGQAVNKLDQVQGNADAEARKVAAGQGNLHEMALALEKADIAMRLALKVRNKVVDAYNEIMRMSV